MSKAKEATDAQDEAVAVAALEVLGYDEVSEPDRNDPFASGMQVDRSDDAQRIGAELAAGLQDSNPFVWDGWTISGINVVRDGFGVQHVLVALVRLVHTADDEEA